MPSVVHISSLTSLASYAQALRAFLSARSPLEWDHSTFKGICLFQSVVQLHIGQLIAHFIFHQSPCELCGVGAGAGRNLRGFFSLSLNWVQILSFVGKMNYHAWGLWIRKIFRKIFLIVSFEGISLLSIWFAAAGALIIKGISSVPSTEFAVQGLPLLQFWFLSKV